MSEMYLHSGGLVAESSECYFKHRFAMSMRNWFLLLAKGVTLLRWKKVVGTIKHFQCL